MMMVFTLRLLQLNLSSQSQLNWNSTATEMFKKLSQKFINDANVERVSLSVPKRPTKDVVKEWLTDKIVNFCNVTSLHGYNHTVNKEYRAFERRLWTLISILALITAIILLWISSNWTSETPTTTVIESTNYPTYNLPFPAVTVCNMNKISQSAVFEFVKKLKRPDNLTDDEVAYKLRLLLHFRGSGNATAKEYQMLNDILDLNNENVNSLVERFSPKCDDMLERCLWKGSILRCDSLFQPINTSEGMCCSFNNYAFPRQNYDPKMLSIVPKEPRRVTACGYQTGLTILLKPDNEDYFATEVASNGFRLMIHDSFDYADSNSVVKLLQSQTEAYLSISPESTYSTDDVFKLPPETRDCLQTHERQMDSFRQYSYVNCMAECRSAIIQGLCGCVPFTLPNNGSYNKCKMTQLHCVRSNSVNFAGSTFRISNDSSEISQNLRKKCRCLPDCSFYAYPLEISTGMMDRRFSFNSINFFKDTNLTDQSLVHIFFNDLIATHYRKDMYQNWLGVLAAFGGLLGLFLGFSLVTGFELVYFFTIRTFFDKLAAKSSNK